METVGSYSYSFVYIVAHTAWWPKEVVSLWEFTGATIGRPPGVAPGDRQDASLYIDRRITLLRNSEKTMGQ
jgi:hypothetical protein